MDLIRGGSPLPTENRIGITRNGVRILHMRIPIGNVQPLIVRGRHIGVGRDLILIPTLQIPIGNRHTPGRLGHIRHFHLGAVRRIRHGFAIDPVRTVFRSRQFRLKRVVRRTNPNGRSGFSLKQRIVPTIRQGRPPPGVLALRKTSAYQ